jgi:organic hydroperoxide reductase OsmC/OhrA
MCEHTATVKWKRETPDFSYQAYNRDHDWVFDAGITQMHEQAHDACFIANSVKTELIVEPR